MGDHTAFLLLLVATLTLSSEVSANRETSVCGKVSVGRSVSGSLDLYLRQACSYTGRHTAVLKYNITIYRCNRNAVLRQRMSAETVLLQNKTQLILNLTECNIFYNQ